MHSLVAVPVNVPTEKVGPEDEVEQLDPGVQRGQDQEAPVSFQQAAREDEVQN